MTVQGADAWGESYVCAILICVHNVTSCQKYHKKNTDDLIYLATHICLIHVSAHSRVAEEDPSLLSYLLQYLELDFTSTRELDLFATLNANTYLKLKVYHHLGDHVFTSLPFLALIPDNVLLSDHELGAFPHCAVEINLPILSVSFVDTEELII